MGQKQTEHTASVTQIPHEDALQWIQLTILLYCRELICSNVHYVMHSTQHNNLDHAVVRSTPANQLDTRKSQLHICLRLHL